MAETFNLSLVSEDLFLFIKDLTDCQLPSITSFFSNKYHRDELVLKPHQPNSCVYKTVGITYPNESEYWKTFIPLMIEECRQSRRKDLESLSFLNEQSSFASPNTTLETVTSSSSSSYNKKRKLDQNLYGQYEATIDRIIYKSDHLDNIINSENINENNPANNLTDCNNNKKKSNSNNFNSNSNNRVVSVWIIRLQVRHTRNSSNSSNVFNGGDLLYITGNNNNNNNNSYSAINRNKNCNTNYSNSNSNTNDSCITFLGVAHTVEQQNVNDNEVCEYINLSVCVTPKSFDHSPLQVASNSSTSNNNDNSNVRSSASSSGSSKRSDNANNNSGSIKPTNHTNEIYHANGWTDESCVYVGAVFQILTLKNITPALREVTAIKAVSTWHEPLKSILLTRTMTSSNNKNSNISSSSSNNNNNSSSSSSSGSSKPSYKGSSSLSSTEINTTNSFKTSNTFSKNNISHTNSNHHNSNNNNNPNTDTSILSSVEDISRLSRPPLNVPPSLWAALISTHNPSQLQAIYDVCVSDVSKGHHHCFSLLQGPPGTGKTKTILGIVSIILAGAGAQRQQRRGVPIVAGASLLKSTSGLGSKINNKASSSSSSIVRSGNTGNNNNNNHNDTVKNGVNNNSKCISSTRVVELSESQPDRRPRLLICAPSNIAVDEIVDRLVREGVLGSDGRRREKLSVVRVGLSGSGGSESHSGGKSYNGHTMNMIKNEESDNNEDIVLTGSTSISNNNIHNNNNSYSNSNNNNNININNNNSNNNNSNNNNSNSNFGTNSLAANVQKVSLDYLVKLYKTKITTTPSTAFNSSSNSSSSFNSSSNSSSSNSSSSSNNNYNSNFNNMKITDIWCDILEKADVVCCTLSGAGSPPLVEFMSSAASGTGSDSNNNNNANGVISHTNITSNYSKFAAVIIDEASQAVEPSTLIPLQFHPKTVVLVGDPNQLPATVFSHQAKHKQYGQSLFQRLALSGYPVRMLNTQYRMHEAIAAFPSQRYYHNNLKTSESIISYKPNHDDDDDDGCRDISSNSNKSGTTFSSCNSSSSSSSSSSNGHKNKNTSIKTELVEKVEKVERVTHNPPAATKINTASSSSSSSSSNNAGIRYQPFHENYRFRPFCMHDVYWGREESHHSNSSNSTNNHYNYNSNGSHYHSSNTYHSNSSNTITTTNSTTTTTNNNNSHSNNKSRNNGSLFNRVEAEYVIHLYFLLEALYPQHNCHVAILCPYKAQRLLITKLYQQEKNRRMKGSNNNDDDVKRSIKLENHSSSDVIKNNSNKNYNISSCSSNNSSSNNGGNYNNNNNRNNNNRNNRTMTAVTAGTDSTLEISTVDAFQGREVDIAIFSCVRSSGRSRNNNSNNNNNSNTNNSNSTTTATTTNNNNNGNNVNIYTNTSSNSIGFLAEWQRLNVAITRSKYALWIVGDLTTLASDTEWQALIQHAYRQQCIVAPSEPCIGYDDYQWNVGHSCSSNNNSNNNNSSSNSNSSNSTYNNKTTNNNSDGINHNNNSSNNNNSIFNSNKSSNNNNHNNNSSTIGSDSSTATTTTDTTATTATTTTTTISAHHSGRNIRQQPSQPHHHRFKEEDSGSSHDDDDDDDDDGMKETIINGSNKGGYDDAKDIKYHVNNNNNNNNNNNDNINMNNNNNSNDDNNNDNSNNHHYNRNHNNNNNNNSNSNNNHKRPFSSSPPVSTRTSAGQQCVHPPLAELPLHMEQDYMEEKDDD